MSDRFDMSRKVLAKFNGGCSLCTRPTIQNKSLIVPDLSITTTKGFHPWVHLECAEKLVIPGLKEKLPKPKGALRFIATPPVSSRQKDVLIENLESILKALMANPTKKYKLTFEDDNGKAGSTVCGHFNEPLNCIICNETMQSLQDAGKY